MSVDIRISDRMAQTVEFVAKEAKLSKDEAVKRIFALAETVYKVTDSDRVQITDPETKASETYRGIRSGH